MPAARPRPVPNSGKSPATAPHGSPIASAASQAPRIARCRATSATMRGRRARWRRERMDGATKSAPMIAVRPMTDDARYVGTGPPRSQIRPPTAGPDANAGVREERQPAECAATRLVRRAHRHVGTDGRQEEGRGDPGKDCPQVQRRDAIERHGGQWNEVDEPVADDRQHQNPARSPCVGHGPERQLKESLEPKAHRSQQADVGQRPAEQSNVQGHRQAGGPLAEHEGVGGDICRPQGCAAGAHRSDRPSRNAPRKATALAPSASTA